ncbi:MAG: BrnT family toxin [Steroidobacteraceae bacterium]
MIPRVAGFDWDAGNRAKCTRHGVSIEEIEAVFRGEVAIHPDLTHSTRETRYLGIGRGIAGRYVFTAFTLRQRGGETWIRVISARYMHAEEIRHFQEAAADRHE